MRNIVDVFFIAVLAIIALVDSSWAGCSYSSTGYTVYSGNSNALCKGDPTWGVNLPLCSSTAYCQGGSVQNNGVSYTDCWVNYSGRDLCVDGSWGTVYAEYRGVRCRYSCTSLNSADSVACELSGKIWDVHPVSGVGSCVDSVSCNWTVSTIPRLRCLDVPASGQIVCKDNECSGLPYSMWWSELRIDSTSTRCGNISHVHTSDTSYTFGSQCDVEERCSDEKKCYSQGGTFYIVQECAVGRPVIGNDGESQKTVPYIVSTGKGSCSEMGYRNENYNNSGGGIGNLNATNGTPPPIDDDCLIYGINCPEPDTTNYKDPPNQNPSKCFCEPFDGLNSMSKVTCPDGTVSVYYFSCLEWEYMFISSSVSQSSSSAPPASSVGGTSSPSGGSSSDTFGQYPQYPEQDGAFKKNVQAALSGEASLLNSIKEILGSIKDYLFSTPQIGDDVFSLDVPTDSSTYDTTQINFVDSLLAVIDTAHSPVDTSLKAQTGVCPIISANFGTACRYIPGLAGNTNANMRIDTSNIAGINLCGIIRSLIIAFSSVVSFIIGARLFRQIQIT